MKRNALVWMLMICAVTTFAQTLSTEEQSQSVYFASGATELTDAGQTALNQAIDFAKKPENESYSVILRAYTDDVGSMEHNKALSQQRAEAVYNYLISNGLTSESIQRFALGTVELPSSPTAADRAAARRVDVFVLRHFQTPKMEDISNNELINSFLENINKENEQTIRFSCREAYSFIGNKGTVVQIPENAFVYADNATPAQGEVLLSLREAYSYGDMLLQQLGTVSNGKMLETGGMVRLTATDAQGRELAIASGKEILVSMPTEEVKSKDMQVFMGEAQGGNGINWNPTNNLVANPNNGFMDAFQSYSTKNPFLNSELPAFFHADSFALYRAAIQQLPHLLARLPRAVPVPAALSMRKPQRPKLTMPTPPNKAELAQRYPQPQRETAAEYQISIQHIYRSELEKYYQQKNNYQQKLSDYRRDSSAYERALARHQKETVRYAAYQREMQAFTQQIQHSLRDINPKEQFLASQKLIAILNALDNAPAELQTQKAYLEKAFTGADSLRPYLDQTTAVKIPQLDKRQTQLLQHRRRYLHSALVSIRSDEEMSSSTVKHDWTAFQRRTNSLNTNEPMKRAQIQTMRNLYTRMNSRYRLSRLPRLSSKLEETLKDMDLLFQSCWAARSEMQMLYRDKVKTENSPEAVALRYANALRITEMGWINCDRFIDGSEREMPMEVLAENGDNDNTLFFAVFENIRSVMPLKEIDNRFLADPVPASASVKLVGIRVTSATEAEVFITQGKVREFAKVQAEFKAQSLDELKGLLAKL